MEISTFLISMKNPLTYQIMSKILKSRTFKKSSILIVIMCVDIVKEDSPSLDETVRELNSRLQEENKNLHQVITFR